MNFPNSTPKTHRRPGSSCPAGDDLLQDCARLPSLADRAVPSSVGGPQRPGGTPCRPRVPAARDCSPSTATPSRAAVTRRAAAGRGRGAVATSALTAVPAHNPPRSAGVGAAIPADVTASFVVSVPSLVGASGTATDPQALSKPPAPVSRPSATRPVLHFHFSPRAPRRAKRGSSNDRSRGKVS